MVRSVKVPLMLILLIIFIWTNINIVKADQDDDFINIEPGTFKKEELIKADKESAAQMEVINKWIRQVYGNNTNKNVGDISIQWTYPVKKILDVPHHEQQTSYWCGPASILQIIDYNGREDRVKGTTEYEKQKTLAQESGTTTNGANTLSLRNTLNKYVSDLHSYNVTRIDGSSGDYDTLWDIIDFNIFEEEQPILLLVNTKYLPYYNGKESYHYIVVDGMIKQITDSTGQPAKSISEVRIVDPNYQDAYSGYFTVYFIDLYQAVKGYYEKGQQAYNVSY